MLPALNKMGIRGLGIWQLIYPEPATSEEHDDYDEVMMIQRYASYEHWQACKNPMRIIGNGPDFKTLEEASSQRESLIQDKWHRFLQGELYRSPPTYIPPLSENYKKV
jgi:hypothetical protein